MAVPSANARGSGQTASKTRFPSICGAREARRGFPAIIQKLARGTPDFRDGHRAVFHLQR